MKANKRLRVWGTIVLLGLALTLLGQPAPAAVIYWDGPSASGWNLTADWSTASNATTPNPSAVPGSGDTAIFNVSTVNTAQTINLNAAQAVGGLIFSSTGTTLLEGGGSNQTLSLGTSGITVNAGAGAVTIGSATSGQQVAVSLQGSESWTNNGSGVLTVNNGASPGIAGNLTLTLSGSNTGNNTITGGLVNGTGTLSVLQGGSGNWILSGTNTYTGGTSISSGTLQFKGSSALPGVSAVSLASAALQIRNDGSGSNGTISLGNSITLSAAATTDTIYVSNNGGSNTGNTVSWGVLSNGASANALASTINFTAANSYLQSYGGLGLSGSTGNTTTLNPTTTSVTIAGNVTNQESGALASHYDTLDLDGTSTGNVISGVISDATGFTSLSNGGYTQVTKTNASLWTLTGSNTYSGGTTISAGTLALGFNVAGASAVNILPSSSGVTLGGGALVLQGSSSVSNSQTVGALTINGGTSAITLNANGASSLSLTTGGMAVNGVATLVIATGTNSTLTIGNTWSQGAGAQLLLNLGGGSLSSSPATTNGLIGGWVTVKDANGTSFATVSGGNVISSAAGGTVLPASAASSTTNYWLGGATTSSQTVTTSQTANSLSIIPAANGNSLTISTGTLGLTANALSFDGTHYSYTIGGPGQFGSSSLMLTVNATGSNALTIAAPINSGAGGLNLLGVGTLIVTASNSFSGSTTVSPNCTFQVGGGGVLGGGNYNGAIADGGTLTMSSSSNQTLGGAISGAGVLNQNGSGATTLTAANSYSGQTTINGGALTLAGSAASSGGAALVVGNTASGVLNISTTGTVTFDAGTLGNAAGAAGVINQSAGLFTPQNNGGYVAVGAAVSGYGAINLSGGTMSTPGNTGFRIGDGGVGVLAQTGGSLNSTRYFVVGANSGGTNLGSATFTGGSAIIGNGTYYVILANASGANGVMNIGTEAGGNAVVSALNANFYVGQSSGGTGTLNLDSGTLGTSGQLSTASGATGTINFNGGTLQAGAAGLTLINNSPTKVSIFNNGATFDTQSNSATVSANLLASSGGGIYPSSGTISVSGGSGYLGAPYVTISGGGGSGAMGIADISNGAIVGVTLTCPGQGYTAGSALTLTFSGGGAATPLNSSSYTLQSGDVSANAGGGVTKVGDGLLTLSGTNSYSGGTTIANGDILFSSTASIPGSGTINPTNGALLAAGAYTTVTAWLGSNTISTTSSGAIALTGTSTETISMGSYSTLSLGASTGLTATYTGALTPAGNTYYLGGGGGTLLLPNNQALTGSGTNLTVGLGGGGTDVVLSGSENYTGTTTIASGTLQIGSGGGGEGLSSLSIIDNGTLAFSHTDSLSYGGVISGGGNLVKLGTGILTLTGNNTFSGSTTVSAGTLDVANATALQNSTLSTGRIVFDASVSGNAFTFGGLSGSGSISLTNNAATPAAVALSVGNNNASTTSSIALSGNGSLTKIGIGALSFTGTNTYTGATNINGGTLTLSGSAAYSGGGGLYVGNTSNGVLNLNSTGAVAFNGPVEIGVGSGVSGVINQSAGTFNAFNSAGNYVEVGYGGAYGAYNLSGGTLNANSTSGISIGGKSGTGIAIFNQSGGLITATRYIAVSGAGGTYTAAYTMTGGTTQGSSSYPILVGNAAGGIGVLNMGTEAGGSGFLVSANGSGLEVAGAGGATGILNLNSGRVQLTSGAITNAGGIGTVNFDGGTVQANAAGLTLINTTPTSVNIYNGGAIFSTLSNSATISANLLATSGNGIYPSGGAIAVSSGSGGSGYIGAPYVSLTDTTGGGSGAMAVATLANGAISGVTLTCPGQGYNVGDVLTFSFSGGGAATPASSYSYTLRAGDIAANTTGGLTKLDAGMLTLTGLNTYTGITSVTAGTLALGVGGSSGALAPASVANVAAAAVLMTTVADGEGYSATGAVNVSGLFLKGPGNFHESLARPFNLSSGTIAAADTGDTGAPLNLYGTTISTVAASGLSVISVPSSGSLALRLNGSTYGSFNTGANSTLLVNANLADYDSAGDPLIVNGSGTMVLTGTNTYSLGTQLNGGTLQVGNGGISGTLGSGNITNNAALAFSRSDSPAYANSISGTGALYQIGSGSTILTGSNTYSGNTFVNSGRLYLNGPNGTPAITVAAGAVLGGSGSASSAVVTVNNGGSVEGGQGGLGTLNVAALNFLQNATIDVNNISNYASVAAIDVTGSNGLAAYGNGNSITFSLSGAAPLGNGSVHLLQYNGSIGGSGNAMNSLQLNTAGMNLGVRSVLALTTTDSGYIDLLYSVDYPMWTGSGDCTWSTGAQSPKNWKLASNGNLTDYLSGDSVVFDDTAGSSTVNINVANVTPNSIAFNNNALNYTLQGPYGIAGTTNLVINGSGGLTLAASNGYTGGTFINAGTLKVANANALPSGAGTGNVALSSTGAAVLDLNGMPAVYINGLSGGSAALGAQVINSGTGTATLYLGAGSAVATFSGVIADNNGSGGQVALNLTGSGMQTLAAANTYSGGTTVSGGTLQLGNANALSSGILTVNAGAVDLAGFSPTLSSLSGPAGTISVSSSQASNLTVNQSGSTTFGGSLVNGPTASLGLTQSGGTLVLTGTNTMSGQMTVQNSAAVQIEGSLTASSITVSNSGQIAGAAGVVKVSSGLSYQSAVASTFSGTLGGAGGVTVGNGALTLNGSNSYAGQTTVNGGVLALNGSAASSGAGALVVGNTGNGVLNIATTGTVAFNGTVNLGNAAGVAGVINQSAGTFNALNNNDVYLTIGNGGYGAYNLSGGTLNILDSSGVRIGESTATAIGIFNQTGGHLTSNRYFAIGTNGIGVATFGGGSMTVQNGYKILVGDGTVGVMNLGTEAGGNAVVSNVSTNVQIGGTGGTINLNSGTLAIAGGITKSGANPGTVNFNGGTLQELSNNVTLVDNTPTSVNIYNGGAIFDTQSNTATVSANLLATVGDGLYPSGGSLAVTSGGSGYLGAPLVTISGGSGVGATAIANITNGSITGVTVTNPGQNYQPSDILTFSFSGGGAAAPAGGYQYTVQSGDVALNSASGVTKLGTGKLVLSGAASTYAGGTTITAGTLQLGSANALGSAAGSLSIARGGVLDLNGFGPNLGGLNGAGLVDDVAGGNSPTLTVGNGNGSGSFAGIIQNTSGNIALVKAGSGMQVLSGANTYSGGTTVVTGTLQLGNAAALGSGGLIVNGGEVDLNTIAISLPSLAGLGGTISDESSSSGTNTLTVAQNGSSAFAGTVRDGLNGTLVALTASGPGMLTLSGSNGFSGGTRVSGGTLQLGGPNALGSGGLTANAGVVDLNGYNLSPAGSNTLPSLSGAAGTITDNNATAVTPTTLAINQSANTTFGGNILTGSNTAGITLQKYGAGNLTLGGTSTTAGGAQVYNSGTLAITGSLTSLGLSVSNSATLLVNGGLTANSDLSINANAQLAGTGTINLAHGAGLYVGSITPSTFGGTLTGIKGVEVDDGASLTLTGSSSYSGKTVIDPGVSGGYFNAGAAGALSPYSDVHVNGGTLAVTAGSQAVNSLAVGGLGTLNLSVGNLLTSAGSASFATGSTLNISGAIVTPDLLMTYGGAQSGAFSHVFNNGNSLPSGDGLSYSGGSVEVVSTAVTFSGSGVWVGTSASWSSSGNWTDGANPGVPGDGTRLAGTDKAAFSGSGSVTAINLDSNPSLAALSFSNSNYTLSGGSLTLDAASGTASITVSGTQTINSSLSLASTTDMVVKSSSDQLAINGPITGTKPLLLDGGGTLILSNSSNSYSGGVYVNSGTLIATASGAIPSGTGLYVGSDLAVLGSPLVASMAGGSTASSPLEASPHNLIAVPEPGTVALMLAALCSAASYRRFRRPKAFGMR